MLRIWARNVAKPFAATVLSVTVFLISPPRYIWIQFSSGPAAVFGLAEQVEPPPHILVVDDQRDIRDLLARYLAKHGFRACVAESADAARRVLRVAKIDLIILDIMMPGEDGLSLTRSVRESYDLPVILLTAM